MSDLGGRQRPAFVTEASVPILRNKWRDEEQPWSQQVWNSFHEILMVSTQAKSISCP